MANVWLIAQNTLREIRSKKLVYLIFFLAVLVGISTVSGIIFTQNLMQANEAELANKVKRASVAGLIGEWSFFAAAFSLFLGAMAISGEVKSKTLAVVLARPIERWQYLLGKWVGCLQFLFTFLFFGVAAAVGIGWYHGIHFSPVFWLGILELFVRVTFFSGVCVGLSTFQNPVLAGTSAFLMTLIPGMVSEIHHPVWKHLAAAVYYVCPAEMPANLIHEGLFKDVIAPNYPLYAKILIENVLYTTSVFLLGSFVFSRRDVPLK